MLFAPAHRAVVWSARWRSISTQALALQFGVFGERGIDIQRARCAVCNAEIYIRSWKLEMLLVAFPLL
jgi:hypothetical protein